MMLRSLPTSNWNDSYIVPSKYWFSRMYNAFPASGWIWGSSAVVGFLGLLIGVCGLIVDGPIALTYFIPIMLYPTLMAGVKFLLGKPYSDNELTAEHAYNKMTRTKRKEYKRFLNSCYGNDRIAKDARELFEQFEDTRAYNIENARREQIAQEIRQELAIAKDARRIYRETTRETA